MSETSLPDALNLERLQAAGQQEVVLFPNLRALPPEFIHSAGFLSANQPTCGWDSRRRGTSELVMIRHTLAGRSRLRYDGRQISVEAGQTLLVHMANDQRHWIEDGDERQLLFVTLAGQNAVRGLCEVIAGMGPIVTFDPKSRVPGLLVDACAASLEGKIDTPYRASELARVLVDSIRGETIDRLAASKTAAQAAADFVLEVEQFCRGNLSRPIGVADMAKVARMSRYHFTRKFERARGVPPGRYLASLRLDEATRLLSHGGHSVKEVAVQCGFRDASYFCKVFRRNFGVSPGSLQLSISEPADSRTTA
jgi:AraC-like DNA-binding protein